MSLTAEPPITWQSSNYNGLYCYYYVFAIGLTSNALPLFGSLWVVEKYHTLVSLALFVTMEWMNAAGATNRSMTCASNQEPVMQRVGTRKSFLWPCWLKNRTSLVAVLGVVLVVGHGWLCHECWLQDQSWMRQNLPVHLTSPLVWPRVLFETGLYRPEPVSWDLTAICWASFHPSVFSFKSNIGFIFSSIKKITWQEHFVFHSSIPSPKFRVCNFYKVCMIINKK